VAVAGRAPGEIRLLLLFAAKRRHKSPAGLALADLETA